MRRARTTGGRPRPGAKTAVGTLRATPTARAPQPADPSPTSPAAWSTPLTLPWVESPFFDRELALRELSAGHREMAVAFHRDGYVVLPGVAPAELCDAVRRGVEPLFDEEYGRVNRRVPDAWNRGVDAVARLASLPAVLEALEMLYGRRPIPFQTLDFKWGTEQMGHSDAIHFTSIPARFMCGAWVAMEDVDEGNGPLFYYPGSHQVSEVDARNLGIPGDDLPYDRYESVQSEVMDALGFEPVEFHAKKGDVLIWSSNIVHGGRPIRRAGSTRWSQVTHYYFADCIYYAPRYSDLLAGELYLKDVTDIGTGEPVPHVSAGSRLSIERLASGRSRVRAVPTGGEPGAEATAVTVSATDRVEQLERALADARSEAAALRRSASYRLGHGLLEPVRALLRGRAATR